MSIKTVSYIVWFGITVGLIGMAVAIGTAASRSSGQIEYCYIESALNNPNNFYLYGFRSWKTDTMIGPFPTLEKTIEAANLIHCPLTKK